MSTLNLDFSDASFDQDDVYRIDSDGFVYEMSAAGPPSGGSNTSAHLEGPGGEVRAKGVTGTNTIGNIAGLDLTVSKDVTFDFEFVDVDGNAADSNGDQYKVTLHNVRDVNNQQTTQEFYASEQLFAGDLTNGAKAPIQFTEVMVPAGHRSIHLDTPFEFTNVHGNPVTANELMVKVVGSGPTQTYDLEVPVQGGGFVKVTADTAVQAFNAQTQAGVTDLQGLVTEMWSETKFQYMGDLGQGESWVVSGDINGRDALNSWTDGDDIIGFLAGQIRRRIRRWGLASTPSCSSITMTRKGRRTAPLSASTAAMPTSTVRQAQS